MCGGVRRGQWGKKGTHIIHSTIKIKTVYQSQEKCKPIKSELSFYFLPFESYNSLSVVLFTIICILQHRTILTVHKLKFILKSKT